VPSANFASQSVPYHAVFMDGSSFTQQFRVQNTDNATWSGRYLLRVGASDSLGGSANSIAIPSIAPGATATISLPLRAVKSYGDSKGAAQLGCWEMHSGPSFSYPLVYINGVTNGRLWTSITITSNVYGPGIPRLNTWSYTSTVNPYVNINYGGQCTAFVWGRAAEQLGVQLQVTSAAGQGWVNALTGAGKPYTIDMTPKANSIAVWKDAYGAGHVAYVEATNGSGNTANVLLNEANWKSYQSYASLHDVSGREWGGGYDGSPQWLTHSDLVNRTSPSHITFLGYIHLT
jgi:surface antigen